MADSPTGSSTAGTRPRASASFPNYAAGTWGPALADRLLERDGRSWKNTVSLARFDLTGTAASGEESSDA